MIATHSEVLIDSTGPERILSFFKAPHPLIAAVNRDQVREALKRLTALDLLRAETSPGILYVEGETDFNLLGAWAKVLDHPLRGWFQDKPFWHDNQGRHPREAKGHFFAMRAIRPNLRGVLLLDGDNRALKDRVVLTEGLEVRRWKRYEAESYLVHPQALVRFIQERGLPLLDQPAQEYLQDQLPPKVWRDPLASHDFFEGAPVSKTILPGFFTAAQLPLDKKEYYLVAERMLPAEIPSEVKAKLDAIQKAFDL